MKLQRYLTGAPGFRRLAGRNAQAGHLPAAKQWRRLHACLNGVLALYPSTTTELPFT